MSTATSICSWISRVVKKGCKVIILTTNLLSPLIFLPKLFLPYPLKSKILTKLFKVKDDDVFPTYHKLNTPNKFLKLRDKFEIKEMLYISDMNYTRRWIFFILFIVHLLIKSKFLNKYRTNIIVVLQKK